MNGETKKSFRLQMLRPDKQFYEGDVVSLTVSEPDGKITLLPGHMPMFINITTSMAALTEAEGETKTSRRAKECWPSIRTESFYRATSSHGKKNWMKRSNAVKRRWHRKRNAAVKVSSNIGSTKSKWQKRLSTSKNIPIKFACEQKDFDYSKSFLLL